VIDGAAPEMLQRAVAAGRAPTLAALIERGSYTPDAVSVFPSVTPVCAASIATGYAQDRHRIPSMNWYHRGENRYVEYGSSFRASLRFGLNRQLTDMIYNMNGAHLAPDTLTVFEQLDDQDLRTAGTTYLMFRGRHLQQPARDSLLTRLASQTVVRKPVLGPRELFYGDIFASRDTGCHSNLGMPGVRDRHAGCVGEYLVKHDLFDFLLLSLSDNDNHSHRHGPEGQIDSLPQADEALAQIFEAGGGTDAFLREHAVIVVADHAHTQIERTISLVTQFTGFADIRRPTDLRAPGEAELALCPAGRSAMLYALQPRVADRVLDRARRIDGVEHVHQPRIVVGRHEAHRHLRHQRPDGEVALDAEHAAAGAGHPDVGDVGRAAGQHARVGGRDVGVGAEHRRHAAVEVPAHRDLLARRLGVHVDEDVVGLAAQLGEQRVGLAKAERPAFMNTLPDRLITARRTPSRETIVWPWPGWPRR
jgi:hypothetical protein